MSPKAMILSGLGLIVALFFVVLVAGIMAMGHPGGQYVIVNETGRPLLTWVIEHDCSVLIAHKYDYSYPDVVAAAERREVGFYGYRGRCIQVATLDRRLVFLQKYEDGAEVVVSEPLKFLSGPVPPADELPNEPRGQWFDAKWWIYLVIFGSGAIAGVAGMLLVVVGIGRAVLQLISPGPKGAAGSP